MSTDSTEQPADCATPAPHIQTSEQLQRVLLFTGHMIDAPGRKQPRFPRSKAPVARAAIQGAVRDHCIAERRRMLGIASCASGGDILFHEVCAELGISTRVFLALPEAQFVERSVAPAGREWIERFFATVHRQPTYVLDTVLATTASSNDCNVWQQTNLWMLQEALRFGADKAVLIALWDGEGGDGPGGTGDLIERAKRHQVTTLALDTKALFSLDSEICAGT
jgi:hypothetical protein